MNMKNWRKASYSTGEATCVEVASADLSSAARTVAVRDSKNLAGPELVFTRQAWAACMMAGSAMPSPPLRATPEPRHGAWRRALPSWSGRC